MRWRIRALIPSSLGGRLLVAATLFVVVALAGAAVLTNIILDRFLHRQIDAQLDSQIAAIRSALTVHKDGSLSLQRDMNGPPFDRPHSGWYWSVEDGITTLQSISLQAGQLQLPAGLVPPTPPPPPPPNISDLQPGPGVPPAPAPPERPPPPLPADGAGPDAQNLHFRHLTYPDAGRLVAVMTSAPDTAFKEPLREAMTAVMLSLGIVAVALIAALYFQVTLGLRPLAGLRRSIMDVRAGRLETLPVDQPREIAPLVTEMNRLIVNNTQNLARARRHVANLAHGLKTPLANLAMALESSSSGQEQELSAQVALMDRHIQHHLRRARVAALTGSVHARIALAPHIEDLIAVFQKIYADRRIAVEAEINPSLEVACEGQDVDEMLGNLLDNAFKYSASRVRITAVRETQMIIISVEDDGPGLTNTSKTSMMSPGKRLDENSPGYGFGLPITQELAELYNGALDLQDSVLGGLRATLQLPMQARLVV